MATALIKGFNVENDVLMVVFDVGGDVTNT